MDKKEAIISSAVLLVAFGVIAFEIWIYVTYGNKPYDEVPPWVWLFMLGGRK